MTEFAEFRWKKTGVVQSLPVHYETHPVFGPELERYEPSDEYEEDKVVVAGHETPVEQRAVKVATPTKTDDKADKDTK